MDFKFQISSVTNRNLLCFFVMVWMKIYIPINSCVWMPGGTWIDTIRKCSNVGGGIVLWGEGYHSRGRFLLLYAQEIPNIGLTSIFVAFVSRCILILFSFFILLPFLVSLNIASFFKPFSYLNFWLTQLFIYPFLQFYFRLSVACTLFSFYSQTLCVFFPSKASLMETHFNSLMCHILVTWDQLVFFPLKHIFPTPIDNNPHWHGI